MNTDFDTFNQIVEAEEYFKFFGLAYEPKVVNVNRLHILRKFSLYIKEIDQQNPGLGFAEKLHKYRAALEQAYQVFLESTPQEQKLFKVFNDKPKNVVTLTEITSD
ncbi:nitrogenase-stabilizing/protective protein NifW [Calothrix sp. PCC 6303]|jgi:nitrogenase-stabilizing/protective protein|uniref:nitrogenase-stabilizing/protective protein NifW n=1 Tax=Calothrix sp. PCC 6303 TaxID=1170562 RepID=UPI0002A055A4|nr:nitrogenase-stabilizing/protective protein NifW [Calothrix sp. PCC 6303]AFY99311.1 Nitrogenase-stabilizing/protective protein nifW [Calothrix sp. PCC 6303]